ncbi:MAG: bifunctional 5,10-methylene-tetrahydrofolate dehydrogenase/5,10-methylene-tetrahydrofolate cyclohydrolase [uncultured bacterium]|nr:MAG: bifunctional 5,10-methylene-tetrahydrofolate dehydrogenase/5,10-methylene-tetrahydrofolate cyclohydrolase [uncultured bacterium]HBD05713.1 bifunctional 5,10-methylene-tetrahydrofolate dehydrogenase/5,10-methylene-tetrahydrofolate cyclohydrolase [Candidatus Uhrbacteria bacterium]
MPCQIIDGSAIAKQIRDEVKEKIEQLPSKPGLAVILVGSDPASHVYVGLKEKACKEVGINSERYLYFATVDEIEILNKIEELNGRYDINGILVQLPLPSQDENKIISAIDPSKDVDGFHPTNIESLKNGTQLLLPPTALGIMRLIEASGRPITGLKAVIIASEIFAAPIKILLADNGVASESIRADDPELAAKTKKADIVIVAIGRPNFIKAEMIQQGAIVIDVGTTRVGDKIVGDVERESVEKVAGWLTPVPGGVGPMTVAMLMANVLRSYEKQNKLVSW